MPRRYYCSTLFTVALMLLVSPPSSLLPPPSLLPISHHLSFITISRSLTHRYHPGFGLIGHLWEMAKSSSLSVNVYFDSIPLIEGTQDLAMAQVIPGGTMNNHQWLFDHVVYDKVPLFLFFLSSSFSHFFFFFFLCILFLV